MGKQQLSRRQFLTGIVLGGGSAALAACGVTPAPAPTVGGSAGGAAPTAVPEATSAPAVSTPAQLIYWDWAVTGGPALEEELKLFTQATGIKVTRVVNAVDKYPDLFAMALRGGDAPDVFYIPQKPTFAEQVQSAWLTDLTRFNDFADFRARYPEPDLNFAEGTNTIGGKTYSAPFSDPKNAMWLQLWVNTKVFRDAGLVDASGEVLLPRTADDMLAAARTIKETSGGKVYGHGFGFNSDAPQWAFWTAQLSGADNSLGGLDLKTGAYSYASNPAYKAALQHLLTMRDEGLILPDSASVDDETIRVLFAQHRFGMLYGGGWIVSGWQKTNPEFSEFAATHVPLYGAGEPKSYFYAGPGGQMYGISAGSKNPEASWELFKWLHAPEAHERLVKARLFSSVFPAANKPEYFPTEAEQYLNTQGPVMSRFGPQPALRNPEVAKVQLPSVKPDEKAIVQGLYTGQLTSIDEALAGLDAAKAAAFAQAIKDAQAAGAKVSAEDYVFADWEMTKDYVTKAG